MIKSRRIGLENLSWARFFFVEDASIFKPAKIIIYQFKVKSKKIIDEHIEQYSLVAKAPFPIPFFPFLKETPFSLPSHLEGV